jgi:hypothetical protein
MSDGVGAATRIELNGVKYVREDSAPKIPTGNRAVIVIDRGWIAAGDVTEANGRIKLTRAIWVFKWEAIGFDEMIANPKSDKVTLRPLANGFDIPANSEIFRVPVDADWGV